MRIEAGVEDIVMVEAELRCSRSKVSTAPLDHPLVEVDADVAFRLGVLLDKLPRDSPAPAPAPEVEDGASSVAVWEDGVSRGILECFNFGWADEGPHLRGWDRQHVESQSAAFSSVKQVNLGVGGWPLGEVSAICRVAVGIR